MTSSYDTLYSRFLSRIEDYKLLSLNEEDIAEMLKQWLRGAVAKPYVRRIFDTLSFNDERGILTFTIKNPVDDDSDAEYVSEVITIGMVIEWLEPQVKSVINISQMFGSNKEAKFYAQANHLSTIKELLDDTKIEQRKLIRDHGYLYNSYISED